MKEINHTGVRTLSELRAVRAELRIQAEEKEAEIKGHFQPVQRILNLLKGKRKHTENADGDAASPGILSAVKIILPLLAGRQLLKHKNKLLGIPLLGYLIKEGAGYLISKNLKTHITDLKHMFQKHPADKFAD